MFKRLLIPVIVALLVIGLMTTLTVTAQTPTPIPTLTPIPSATNIPLPTTFYLTTVEPSATPGCPPPLPLVPGATAYVRGGVYVRSEASDSSPWVNYYTEAVTVTIVEGPVCYNQRYNWWRVRGPGNDGWVAEGRPGFYLMSVGALPSGSTCDASAALAVGIQTLALRDLNVHQTASLDGLVLTVAPQNALLTVLEGPTCAEGYNWWKISVTVVNVVYTGWVADGQPGGEDYLVSLAASVPTPVCYSPTDLVVGGQGYVNYDDHTPKNLRAAPDENAELIATLFDGIGFEVIGGPACSGGLNWWEIRILSRPDVSGWIAEGGPGNIWLTPLRDDINPIPPVVQ